MNEDKNYLKLSDAIKHFGVSPVTLYNWERDGIIRCFRTSTGGNRRFIVDSFKHQHKTQANTEKSETSENKGVCYCRVSTSKQKDDLERQVEYISKLYPDFEIIKDTGSGINFKRKGLLKLLKGTITGLFKTIVVSSKDRLTRFGFELFEWLFNYYGATLVVLDKEIESEEQELTKDILTIMHVFSCKANGKRRYFNRKQQSKKDKETENSKEGESELTDNLQVCSDKED